LFSYLAVKVRAEQEGTSINYRKISRDDVLKLLVRCRLTFNNQEQLVELLETSCINNETIEEDLFLTLTELYKGTSNGYLSEIYEAITGEKAEVIGKVDELFKCPCCNRKTLSESYDSVIIAVGRTMARLKLIPTAVLIGVRYLNIEVRFKKIPTFTIKKNGIFSKFWVNNWGQ